MDDGNKLCFCNLSILCLASKHFDPKSRPTNQYLHHTITHTHTHTLQSEFLNIYSAYLNEFKVAVKTLAKYEQTSSQFRELLSMCQHSPQCEGLSLASYLLTPVQRLPRYELLLKVGQLYTCM